MPAHKIPDLDLAVILYFSALGVGPQGVGELFRHKLRSERICDNPKKTIANLKNTGELWDPNTQQWDTEEVGKHLAKLMKDRKLKPDFEDIIQFGHYETEILVAAYVNLISLPDMDNLLITNIVNEDHPTRCAEEVSGPFQ